MAVHARAVKWSQGTGEDFPRLLVKVRPELVTFGRPEEVEVDEQGVVGGGQRLPPQQLHELVADKGEDVVFFDGRNTMEAAIGRFRDAVVPDVTTTRDFLPELESGRYDELKDKTVVTYCTGGIRCEVLTVLMKNRGFQHVYQLDGGIVRYGEAFRDKGLWEGSLYTFDGTMHREFADGVLSLGRCIRCGEPTPRYVNCGATVHTLRRTVENRLISGGTDPRLIERVMGHTSATAHKAYWNRGLDPAGALDGLEGTAHTQAD